MIQRTVHTFQSPMPITTTIAPSYGWRMLFIGVLCVVFGAWGAYDYWVKIPQQEQRFARFDHLRNRLAELQQAGTLHVSEREEEYVQVERELNQLAPGGKALTNPSKFNRATQLVYTSCILFAPYFFWLYAKTKKQVYRLNEDGSLHFTGDPQHQSGTWTAEEIADIDMSRWMAKSIAHAVHADGRKLKLDAYLHKHLDRIIGAIASRIHPDQWGADARPIKVSAEEAIEQPAVDNAA